MATQSTTGLYPFDPYGSATTNKITYERQTLQTPGRDDYFFIIPQAAPFFVTSLVVRNNATGDELVEGVDYLIGHYFVEAMNKTGRAIAGSIRFLNRSLTGVVSMDYQTVGGQWGFDDQSVLAELSNRAVNPLTRAWAQIDNLPATFPPVPHDQSVDNLIGFEEVTEAVGKVADALGAAQEGATESHLTNYENPHQVTKAQVGLNLVANYRVATESEAESGTRNDRYMTPATVRGAITKQVGDPLDNHTDNQNNPHQVTKSQVGLGNVPNYPTASDEESAAGTATNKLMTPAGVRRAISFQVGEEIGDHASNTSNPHQVSKTQIGLGFVENFPLASLEEAEGGTRGDRYMSPALSKALIDSSMGNVGEHISDRENPHQVTKTQLGLGNVENYPMATREIAETGSSLTHMMSPGRTTDMLEKFYSERVAPYFGGSEDNPTGITKEQIGLGNVENYGIATSEEASIGSSNTTYMTPLRTAETIQALLGDSLDNHANNTENPHQVTAEQVGAVTPEELNLALDGYLPVGNAAVDTQQVFGKDETTLIASILEGTAANADRWDGLSPAEYRTTLNSEFVQVRSFDINAIANTEYVRVMQRTTLRDDAGEIVPSGHISFLVTGLFVNQMDEAVIHLHIGEPDQTPVARILNAQPTELELFATANGDIQEIWFKSTGAIENVNFTALTELDTVEVVWDPTLDPYTATNLINPVPIVIEDPLNTVFDDMTAAFEAALAELNA